MYDKFQPIRPYTEAAALEAMPHFAADPEFAKALKLIKPEVTVETIQQELKQATSVEDFQHIVAKRFMEFFISDSTHGLTCSGIENINREECYLFIANHRDIVLDSALLHYYFFSNNFNSAQIAIGDNLLYSNALKECARLNKMFLVKRSVTLREKLVNFQLLSDYIACSLLENHESVWIAQGNGRAKNGIDQTQQGLVKMITMSGKNQDLLPYLKKLKIVPVSISYEYESCDQLKAREKALSKAGNYVKAPDEDFNSIKQGLFGQKGRVNIAIGTPIGQELDAINPQLSNNDKIVEVCRIIDRQIYQNYKLYPNNYIAYDYSEQSSKFSDQYTPQQKEDFLKYLMKKSIVPDVEPDAIFENLLNIYGNPVKTCLLGEIFAEENEVG
ncbi:MAG: 1-acyl-sn-glycerol-3-phosphate acyltransferase [Bacteroidales bacterium]|jgi:1-acyl-sn-glycerol-3-phosphate acyltransferase|nr:1-acyl-sn-glycerol-3-phosphate acyltransferase [Bacteroidales bacterium]